MSRLPQHLVLQQQHMQQQHLQGRKAADHQVLLARHDTSAEPTSFESASSDSSASASSSTNSICDLCVNVSQKRLRVLIIGTILSITHLIGVLISVCLLVQRLLDPSLPDKPWLHVCTTAILCPLFGILRGLTAITIQLVGSVCGLTINLLLVVGALNNIAWALLVWLLAYAVAICGCIILFGVILNSLLIRQSLRHDVHSTTMALAVVPFLLSLLYMVCWFIVLVLWKKIKRRHNRVFECVE